MKNIKVVLAGIVFILSSLFFMGVCIINSQQGVPQGIALTLFIIGVLICIAGFFFVRDKD